MDTKMKLTKIIAAFCAALTFTTPVAADIQNIKGVFPASDLKKADENYDSISLFARGTLIDSGEFPAAPYYSDGKLMVPLRAVAESLGLRVEWNAETGEVNVDDDYIRRATLFAGDTKASFKGHLKSINMDMEWDYGTPFTLVGDSLYVPVEFFEAFIYEVQYEISGGVLNVDITPQMSYLD